MKTYDDFVNRLATLERDTPEWNACVGEWMNRGKPAERVWCNVIATIAEEK